MIDFNDAGPIVPKVAVSGDGSTGVIPLKGNAPVAGPGAEIIPFGKYRGQPAEILAADRDYADWLVAQPWFRERYGNIYNLVINNFQEAADTPDHNAIQVLFLDRKVCAIVADIALGDAIDRSNVFDIINIEIEHSGGADVYFTVDGYRERHQLFIEIKPSIGDEFPTVLRQIKRRMRYDWGTHVLFIERYVGKGATKEQFINAFEGSNIKVVFRDQLDAGG